VDTLARWVKDLEERKVDRRDVSKWKSDSLLVRSAAHEARSLILGFKDPEDPHSWETGMLPATRAESILAGMRQICELGGEIYWVFRRYGSISTVAVRLKDPRLAPLIRDLSVVDYIHVSQVVPIID
jgi:hypothetical protein